MSTLTAERLGISDSAMCLMSDPIQGSSKAWVTINIAGGVPTNNNTFNISSTADLGVGLYKSTLSISLPGSNGSRSVGSSHSQNALATAFNLKGSIYQENGPGIVMCVATESNPMYVSGVVF